MGAEDGRFAPEQIHAPQGVLRMAEDESHDGPSASGFGVYRTVRMRRTTSLFIGMPKANVICWAMRGHPHVGSCWFMSTMAAMTSWRGPVGPGFFWQRAENSCRYCLAVSAEWNRCLSVSNSNGVMSFACAAYQSCINRRTDRKRACL